MKHKHYDVIMAWAEGEKIEFFCEYDGIWKETKKPLWDKNSEYRLKPPEPVVRWLWANSVGFITTNLYSEVEAYGALKDYPIKLEWSRTEFPAEDD